MIQSPFTSVSIPDVMLHEVMLHFFKTNAEKKALVSTVLLMEYSFHDCYGLMLHNMSHNLILWTSEQTLIIVCDYSHIIAIIDVITLMW